MEQIDPKTTTYKIYFKSVQTYAETWILTEREREAVDIAF
jgi:hypothetical protein